MTGDALLWIAVAGLLLLATFLAMAETALTRMNRVKVIALQEEGKRGADTLLKMVEHPERFLNPVLLLLLVCHLVLASLVGVLAYRTFGSAGVALAIGAEVLVIFVLAEAVPKTFAVQHSERAALRVAPVVYAIARFPLVRLLTRALIGMANVIVPGKGLKQGPFVSEEELLALADVAEEEEVIERTERKLIHSIIEFGDTVVREVMVPRPDMVTVEARAQAGDALEVFMSAGFSRIPVFEQGIDDITGILYAKDLMQAVKSGGGERPVREVVRAARFVPETKRVAELMPEMQMAKAHMAIVVDEYGGTAGLVTLEDLIEELVGEIVDEYDAEEAPVEPLPDGGMRVIARMPIDEVNELMDTEFPEGDFDTVGGLMLNLLGHVPHEGETVDYDGHRLQAEKVQGRRIGRVRISKVHRAADGTEEAPADDAGHTVSEDGVTEEPGDEPQFRSGFATLIGRPNVGKSTLLNAILGSKVSIVSDKPQTTRTQVRGVLDHDDVQVVFVDTPGIHKPVTAAGERFNATARRALDDVDVACFVLDATKPLGRGDRFIAARLPLANTLCVVNKVDIASREEVLTQLRAASELEMAEYFPVSAATGEGLAPLVEAIVARLPEGPRYYPEGTVTDVPDAFWVAELVREQLLAVTREELPHSIACRVTEWEWPHITVEILVERDSQKGIVIGKGGEVLKRVGTAVREQLEAGAYLELRVRVEPDWQRRPHALDRLGL